MELIQLKYFDVTLRYQFNACLDAASRCDFSTSHNFLEYDTIVRN